jgi:hypothetical protein
MIAAVILIFLAALALAERRGRTVGGKWITFD